MPLGYQHCEFVASGNKMVARLLVCKNGPAHEHEVPTQASHACASALMYT